MIPEAKIAELRERADIVEIISEYVTLKRAGVNHKGVCPFHADSDPSFNVNPTKQFFHCFGCNASGDVFSFLQRIEGLQFMEAVEKLAGRYGVELPKAPMPAAARTAQDKAREEKARRRYILEEATVFFETNLKLPTASNAVEVLRQRGISSDTAAMYRLGYAPDSWQGLLDYLQGKHVSPREVSEVGLALPRKNGSGFYDRFRNRLVFTITDPSGHPIGFSARVLPGDDSTAKYINSPETKEYTKGKVLYGLHPARVALSKSREAILVEGNFDVVAMAEAGFQNVVAPLGTAFTEEHAAVLRRRVDKVTVMFDGDRAGIAAAARTFPLLAKVGMAAYMAPLPQGEDPDSLIRSSGKEAIEGILKKARGLLDEIIINSAHASDGSTQDVARRVGKLKVFIDAVGDSMARDMYRQKVASAFGVEPSLIFRYLRGSRVQDKEYIDKGPEVNLEPGTNDERELIGLLLDLPELCEQAAESGVIALIRTPQLRKIADQLVYNHRHYSSAVSGMTSNADSDPTIAWLARRGMERLFTQEEIGRKALHEIRCQMEQRMVGKQIEEITHQIKKAHASGDDMMVLTLQRRRTELEKEMYDAHEAFDKSRVRD